MPADWIIKQNEVSPAYTATLTYSTGEAVDLEGATDLTFVMRTMTAREPVKLTGTASVQHAKEGKVLFEPSEADTANPGMYMGAWRVVLAGQEVPMSFPTDGYLWISIESNLTTDGGQTLVGLPEVKDLMGIPPNNRIHDVQLMGLIEAVGPQIEDITGPMAVQVFEEWHEGGHAVIALRHPPNVGFGTTPVLNLLAVSEYRGPIEYNLSVIPNPTAGSVYSVMPDPQMGTITRRTSGGGTTLFWRDAYHGKQQVHVVYAAGQEHVPQNVRRAAIEAVRINFQTTEAVGLGAMTRADDESLRGPPMGFFLPRRSHELLQPTRRTPSVA